VTVELGITPGVVGVSTDISRIGTASSYDLAYWVGTFTASGVPTDYDDRGPETDLTSLLSWACSQIGVEFPTEYADAYSVLAPDLTVSQALRIRGAVLVCPTRISVTMGVNDVVDLINGRYFHYKPVFTPQNPSLCINNWEYGAYVPGVTY
jgi:hypothetical protein